MQFCGHNCASSIGVANVFTVEMKNTPNSIPVLGAVGNKDQGKRANVLVFWLRLWLQLLLPSHRLQFNFVFCDRR